MRVLLVSDFYPPTPGGLEADVGRLAEGLPRRGHDIAVVNGTPHPDLLPGDAYFHYEIHPNVHRRKADSAVLLGALTGSAHRGGACIYRLVADDRAVA
jgi:hypothetical protein